MSPEPRPACCLQTWEAVDAPGVPLGPVGVHALGASLLGSQPKSVVGGPVTVLASAGKGHGLIYATDTGDEQLRITHLRPDGRTRTLTETQVSSAALSDDGETAWYVTGALDDPDREVFRADAGSSEPTRVGSGENIELAYVGGPHPRLIALGRSGDSGADVYAAQTDGALTLVGDAPDAHLSEYAVNPASGAIYISLAGDAVVDEDGSESSELSQNGALIRLLPGETTATTLTDDYVYFGAVVADEGDNTALVVGTTEDEAELLAVSEGQVREIDSSASVPSLFLGEDGIVYFSTTEGEGDDELARSIPADGSEPPTTVLEDVRWAAVAEAMPPFSSEGYSFRSVEAAVDYGARDCASTGTPVVDLFGADKVGMGAYETDVCFTVASSTRVELSAIADDDSDLMLTLTGYGADGPWTVFTEDDGAGGIVPLIDTGLEPGTYRLATTSYTSEASGSSYQVGGCRHKVDSSASCLSELLKDV